MTATPRIYSEGVKKKASDNDVQIYSMDDESKYGKQLYYIGFGDAVGMGFLKILRVALI